jgi:hypothetical protein
MPRASTLSPTRIATPHITVGEPMAIAELMVQQQLYELDDEARTALVDCLTQRMRQPPLAGARPGRRGIDRTTRRQATPRVALRTPIPGHGFSRLDVRPAE